MHAKRSLAHLLAPLVAALVLLGPRSTRAETIAVFPTTGANMTAGELEAAGQVLFDAFAAHLEARLLPVTSTAAQGSSGPAETARAMGADEYLQTSVVRLERRLRVRGELFGADGSRLHEAEMLAGSLDDLSPVANRLAVAIAERTDTRAARTLDNITENERRPRNRLFSEKVIGLKTGVFGLLSARALDPDAGLMFDCRLEAEDYFLEFGAGFMFGTNATRDPAVGGLVAEIGGSYYLAHDNVSPYIGAGVSPRIIGGLNTGIFGFAPYAQIGLMLFRESSTRLYLDLRAAQNLVPLRVTTNNVEQRLFPTELGLVFGIGW